MILAKKLSLTKKDGSVEIYLNVTQMYTIGRHLVIVALKSDDITYDNDKYELSSLERIEVEFT